MFLKMKPSAVLVCIVVAMTFMCNLKLALAQYADEYRTGMMNNRQYGNSMNSMMPSQSGLPSSRLSGSSE